MTFKLARENWASRLGFMLAAMGSAVGLGNIWRFSYVAGENGGGAFLLLYLGCVLIIGIPVLLVEFSIGKKGQSDVIGSFQKLAPGKSWSLIGYLGIGSAFLILSFYGVVAGWSLYYLTQYINGNFWSVPSGGYGEAFGNFMGNPYQPLMWQALFMFITIAIVFTGIKKGIELANKIFMPGLAILLILLALYSLSLDGAMDGIRFLFSPDWSVLKNPSVYLAALGQAFFSLSIGMGAMLTYGSYLSTHEKLPGATVGIGFSDTLFAIVSGIVIFPAVFSFGIEPTSGPPLVFITLPDIFQQIPFGGIVGIGFFLMLSIAAFSSSISILEVPVAVVMRTWNWSRKKASVILGSIMFFFGITASLGMGVWSEVTIIPGKNIMDSMDYIASNIFLPLGGLLMALFVGWYWKKHEALDASDLKGIWIGNLWYVLIKFLAPVIILLIFLQAIEII